MISIVKLYWPAFLISTLLIYFTIRKIIRRLITTDYIDVFIVYNLSIAISISYLILIFFHFPQVKATDFLIIICQFVVFLAGLFLGSRLLKNKEISENGDDVRGVLEGLNKNYVKISFYVSIAALFLYKMWFSYILLTKYTDGDSRITIAKNYRGLDIFFGSIEPILCLILICYLIKQKKIIFKVITLIYLVLLFLSGAKAAILNLVLLFIFINSLVNKDKFKNNLINLGLTSIGVVSLFIIKSFWSGRINLKGVIDRIIHAGDIYDIALLSGNYKQLLGFYDPIPYLLHPFTAIFGVRGYIYPLGAQLLGTIKGSFGVTGTGPNPQLPILNMVLFQNNLFIIIPVCFLVGLFIYIQLFYGLKIIYSKTFGPLFKLFTLNLFYIYALTIYFDLGFYEFMVVKTILLAGLLVLGVFVYRIILNIKNKEKFLLKQVLCEFYKY